MRIPFALAAGAVALACTAPPPPRATRIAVPVVAPARAPAGAPWSLTASDGSGLALVRVEARASVEGPLAFTELHLTFRNGEPREREGRFQLVLPPRAAIARFATEHAGAWQEAEVVPKALARRAYDDFLHRRQDPALLERAAGNQLTAKIFPIAANAEQRLVVAYSQELAGRYVLPLRGLPVIERIDVELAADGAIERLSERAWLPDRDFVAATPTAAAAVRAGGLVAAQVRLAPAEARDVPRALTLLVDTSASRALAFDAYVAAIHSLVRALPGDAALQVVAFDQDTEPVFDGRAAAFGAPHVRRLVARGAAGATDLGQAIARLRPHPRLVLVGDATITAGIEGDELAAAIARAGVARVDVALAGGLRDERAAARLAGGLPRAGAVVELDDPRAAAALAEPVLTDVPVTVAGATWVYPRVLATARPGDTVVVYARTTRPTVDVRVGATRATLRPIAGTPAVVERAVAGAELAELEARLEAAGRDSPGAAALRDAIAAKSVAARILSSQTALLVLERDADYARYGIPRAARGAPAAEQADAPDVDRDGVLDDVDGCPDVAAPGSPGADDGCPVTGRIVVADSAIHVLGEVYFAPGQAELPPGPHEILDAVAEALAANPEIALVEVQGHTDARGDAARNLALSERRARAVVDYLVARGVAAARLTARGYGATQPRAHRHAMNRRVAFLILRRDDDAPPAPPAPVTGELATIQELLAAGQPAAALARARAWRARAPGDVLALVGLGEALEAAGDRAGAARAYGSIIDLHPGRADLRRYAGQRLARLPGALPLELDTYRRAVADRPDHLTGHRLLAYALVRAGRLADAFAAILAGLDHPHRAGAYRGARRVLGEDAAMIGAVHAAATPAARPRVVEELARRGLAPATAPSTRFVLYWETDANDVDLHVRDARGGHAFYAQRELASGGELYADVTTGYGPECFALAAPAAAPYRLSLHYYAQGPMGYGMGVLELHTFDPARGFTLAYRPYVITAARAWLDLGSFAGSSAPP